METEGLVDRVFRNLGFCVTRIAEAQEDERADFRISDLNNSYVVEVKDKFDAESIVAEYRDALNRDDVFLRSESIGYKNTVSNVLDKAAGQLAATVDSENEFRIVWLELAGLDRSMQLQQTMGTIYGTVQLLPMGPKPIARDCYYFKHSVVHRQPRIDGFIVSDGEDVCFATNPFSPRFHALQSTRLYGFFAEGKAVVNPVELENAGQIYVADCSRPRRDVTAVLEYVQRKYGVDRFLILDPKCTTASAKVEP